MKKKQALAIELIHPLNWWLAWLWSRCIGPVYYWRSERVPSNVCERFEPLDQNTLFSWIEWAILEETTSKACNQAIHATGKESELELAQLLQKLLERRTAGLFWKLVEKKIERSASPIQVTTLPKLGLWDWVQAILISWKEVVHAIGNHIAISHSNHFDVLWTGISDTEVAEKENQLDFGFLQNRMKELKILYVVPKGWSAKARDYSKKKGRSAIERDRLALLLSFPLRIRFILHVLLLPWLSPFQFRSLLQVRALVYGYLHRQFRFSTFITSNSAFWPEPPETYLLKSRGVKTIVWFYGGSEYIYVEKDRGISGFLWGGKLILSDEIWVWMDSQHEVFEMRRLPGSKRPHIEVLGPIVCGDSRTLTLSSSEARKIILGSGVDPQAVSRKTLLLYDWPLPVGTHIRRSSGGPNRFPMEMLDRFYETLGEWALSHPETQIWIKPKRSLNYSSRQYSKTLGDFLSGSHPLSKQGRSMILDPLVDPYLGVAASDLLLGLPITSAVFIGICSGKRSGFFYDPLAMDREIVPRGIEPFFLSGVKAMETALAEWEKETDSFLEKQNAFTPRITPDPVGLMASLFT